MARTIRHFSFLFITLCLLNTNLLAQVVGDVSGDNIIDATDYIKLKQILLKKENPSFRSDLNKDGRTDVSDLIVLENYIYRAGHSPSHITKKEAKTITTISPGLVDQNAKSIEVILKNDEPIAGFQLDFSGIKTIQSIKGGLLEASRFTYEINENRVVAHLDKGTVIPPGNNILFTMQYDGELEEICIIAPVFVNIESNVYPTTIGQCANLHFTKEGCEQLKKVIVGDIDPTHQSDINNDGFIDVNDVLIAENFLFRNGPPPPGHQIATKGKVKLAFQKVDPLAKSLELAITNSKPVASFQLELTGIKGLNEIKEGSAIDNDFKIISKNNKIIGFLENGTMIPPGKGTLLKLTYQDTTSSEVCILSPVFSSPKASSYAVQIGECASLIPIISGCMDSLATNYNPEANEDDGSCVYPPKPPKPEKEKPEKVKKEKNKEDKIVEEKEKKSKPEKSKDKEEKAQKEQKEPKQKKEPKDKEKKKEEKIEKEERTEKEKPQKTEKKEEPLEEKEEISHKKAKENKKKAEVVKELDPKSLNEGILIPKLSAVDRINLSNPEKGLMVYDIDADAFIYYDGKAWRVVGSGDPQKSGFDMKKKLGGWKMIKKKQEQ